MYHILYTKMKKFPSIEQFRNVIKQVTHQTRYDGVDEEGKPKYIHTKDLPTLKYRGTTKLHGTNAGIIQKVDGTLQFQSRERILSLETDNAGFYAFMANRLPIIKRLIEDIIIECGFHLEHSIPEVAIFGEWCGGNIQSGVAINGLPKMFVIFAVKIDDKWVDLEKIQYCEVESDQIFNILRFAKWDIEIDFAKPELIQNQLIELTTAVENECPVGKAFGNIGTGEGIVWQCVEPGWWSSEYWFKVKGDKHSASKVKTLAAVDVEAITAINDFVDMSVTESRLEQGLQNLVREQLKPFEMASLGDFIRWIFNDVVKEEHDTIVASELEVKKLGGPISNKARKWYIEKYNEGYSVEST